MARNDSKHLLPINSILFNNSPSRSITYHSLANPTLANPTLANLQDAQDTTVTALPRPCATTAINAKPTKEGFWKRILAKIKKSLLCKREKRRKQEKREVERGEREMCIGVPTGFKHVETSGPRPLRGTIPVVVEEEESEWEDMEQSEAWRDSAWIKR